MLKPQIVGRKGKVIRMKRFQDIKRIAAMSVFSTVLFGQIMCQGSVFFENDGNVYVYFSSGNYEVVTDAASGATVEIASGIGDSSYATVKFSPDGQYMYYITGYNAGVADLWRCEYRKLKEGASGNESYCQFIASNVSYSSFEATNKGVAFEDDNYNLYYFDGNTVRSLGQDVNKFWCSDDGEKIVFECGEASSATVFFSQEEYDEYLKSIQTQMLYGVETSNLDNTFVLANDYFEVFDVTDFDNIFFTRKSDVDGVYNICVTDFVNGQKELGTLVSGMKEPENGSVYYTRASEKSWDVNEIYTDSRGETQDLVQVKEQFAQGEKADFLTDLFVYKDGQEKRIDTLVGDTKYLGCALMYETMKNLIPIDLSMEAWELQSLKDANAYYWVSDYKNEYVHMIDQGGYWQLYEQNAEVYMNNQDILMEENGIGGVGSLAAASSVNEVTVFDSFTRIVQNASILAIDESAIYHMISDDNSDYCSIYKLTDGKSTCIAQNVKFEIIYLYSDGSTTAKGDNDSLILTDENGNRQEVASGVSHYVRSDEATVLYISDYGLWIWQNGESRLLENNAEEVWCSNPLEQTQYLGYTYSLN